jgi:hypothetical protein
MHVSVPAVRPAHPARLAIDRRPMSHRGCRKALNLMLKARRTATGILGDFEMAGAVQASRADRPDEPTAGKPDGSLGRFAIRPANSYLSAIAVRSCVMGSWTPSIVPKGADEKTVYLVVDDFGDLGRSWRETDIEATDFETVITDLLDGQYNNPVRVVGFNTSDGWARDVSKEIADEIRRCCDLLMRDPPPSLEGFLDRHERRDRRQLTFRLV